MSTAAPIVFYLFDIFENAGVELAVKGMIRLLFAGTRFEQVGSPASPFAQTPPQRICSHLEIQNVFSLRVINS